MTDIRMAINAMNADSERWSGVADDLGTAAGQAAALNVASWSFPEQADIDLQPLYTQLQDKVTQLLTEGKTATQDVADELIRVRDVLQGADDNARADLQGLWDYQ